MSRDASELNCCRITSSLSSFDSSILRLHRYEQPSLDSSCGTRGMSSTAIP
uniref:Uncharacterized protein n=1 Tax=Arundo donax TaxID=35708 RepID=A0A0A9CA83_ARUDO